MKRSHRRWHRWVWLLLPPLLAVVLVAAWWFRAPAPPAVALPQALANVAPEAR